MYLGRYRNNHKHSAAPPVGYKFSRNEDLTTYLTTFDTLGWFYLGLKRDTTGVCQLCGAQERKGHLVFGIGCKPLFYKVSLFCLFRLCAVLCAVSSTTLEGSFCPSVSHRNCWLRGWAGMTIERRKAASKRLYVNYRLGKLLA